MSHRFLLMVSLAAFCTVLPTLARGQSVAPDHYSVYLGTYTGADSKGIYRSDLNLKDGKLSRPELVAEAMNASFLAIHPNQKWIYAINEVDKHKGKSAGGVTGFAIGKDGKLTEINSESSVGIGPAHLAIDPTGKWLVVANYGGGSTALLPIDADGKLGAATSFVEHEAVKPQASHAHCATFSPDGKFVFISDAGVDKVHQFKLDAAQGKLVANDPAFVLIGSGSGTGPRHMTFGVDGKHGYLINETNLTMTTLAYDASKGTFKALQTVSTVPKGTEIKGFSTAEVVAHPSGKFVYGSNRGFDSIVTFAVDPKSAELTQTAQQKEGISIPRNFNVDPTGQFLVCGNQAGNSIVVFRIDGKSGALTPTGDATKLGAPVCVVFLAPAK